MISNKTTKADNPVLNNSPVGTQSATLVTKVNDLKNDLRQYSGLAIELKSKNCMFHDDVDFLKGKIASIGSYKISADPLFIVAN